MPRIPLPPVLHGQSFHISDAMAFGLGRSRLRGPDLQRPYRAVRVASRADLGIRELCEAYATRMPASQVFSHTTAASIYDVPLPLMFQAEPTLHEVGERLWDTRIEQGLPVTSPALTWVLLGSILRTYDLVAAGDFFVSGLQPLTTITALRLAVAASAGLRGVRSLRMSVERVREQVDSRPETILRLILVDAGLPEPQPNFVLRSAAGRFIARLDLAYPAKRVGLEYEGDIHRLSKRKFRNDITRRERVEDQSWRMVRVTDDDLGSGRAELVSRVERALTRSLR